MSVIPPPAGRIPLITVAASDNLAPASPGGRAMTTRPDSDIKCGIEAELRRSLSVDEARIAVRVIGGAVTLTGWVNRHFHKYAAEDAVKRVAGVTAIANDVRLWHVTRSEVSDRGRVTPRHCRAAESTG
jgi:BON domain